MPSTMEDVLTQDVNAIEKLLSNGINHLQVQDKYILPPSERPHLSEVSYSESILVVDLQDLDGPNRTRVVEEIRHACEEDGFFQVVSNGRFRSVEHRAVTNASTARISIPTFYDPSKDAFIAPAASLVDEQHPARYKGYMFGELMRIFWSQELKNKTVLDHFKIEYTENNAIRRCHCQFYSTRERNMTSTMEDALTQDVNDVDEKLLSNGINHLQVQDKYILPPSECPRLSEVSYSESIPVVDLKDLDGPNRTRVVEEIRHACVEDGFFQVVSNGRFRSVEHRAVTNASTARISIPTFYGPSEDAFIAPAASLVDEQHPAQYKGYKFGEFMRILWRQELKNKTMLDHFKIEYTENNGE
eukprot:PITA_31131